MPNNPPPSLNSFPVNNLNRSAGLGASGAGGLGLAKNDSLSKNPSSRLGRNRSKSALEQIDISKIGRGRLMTEGTYEKSFGLSKGAGLKGQLGQMRMAGKRSTTKNLSRKNLDQIHDFLSGAIKKGSVSSSSYISRRDKADIMTKSRQLAKSPDSNFTLEDRKDLIKIVDSMRKQYRDSILGRADDKSD